MSDTPQTSLEAPPDVFGIDPGAGAIKIYGPQGGCQLPAIVATNGGRPVNRMAGLAQQKPPLHVRSAAGAFYLGLGAHDWGRPVENLDYHRLTGSPELRALTFGGLTRYGQQYGPIGAPVDVTLGLPLETLTGPDRETTALVAVIRRWLEGTHTWEADEQPYSVIVRSVRATSQPAGALFDFLLDATGAFIPARKLLFGKELGVISVGMNTVELLVVRDGAPVQRFTAGQTSGVRRLLELLNPDGLYSLGELDAQLRAGKLETAVALPIWEREVTGLMERRWGTAFRRFAAVVVVGGGALLLRDALLTHFGGKAYVPDDPVLATARGLYKMALLQARRKRAKTEPPVPGES